MRDIKTGKAAADTAGNKAVFIECNISNTESVKNLVAKTLEVFRTVDILINNFLKQAMKNGMQLLIPILKDRFY